MKQLRLLLFENCNRNCKGCCNKDWDLKNLPIVKSFAEYNTIMLTGGEPMLNPNLIVQTCKKIIKESLANIYLYTAKVNNINDVLFVLPYLDGLTVTLHEQKDVSPFLILDSLLEHYQQNISLRVNIFKNVKLPYTKSKWKIKDHIEWIKDCPLPENEIFMRL